MPVITVYGLMNPHSLHLCRWVSQHQFDKIDCFWEISDHYGHYFFLGIVLLLSNANVPVKRTIAIYFGGATFSNILSLSACDEPKLYNLIISVSLFTVFVFSFF